MNLPKIHKPILIWLNRSEQLLFAFPPLMIMVGSTMNGQREQNYIV